jgi:stromal membrane-associated protein
VGNGNNKQQQFQGNDIFASMDSSPAPAPTKEQPKPQIDFKSSILSLYNTQPQAPASAPFSSSSSFMNNGGNFNAGGNYQQQLSGVGGGFSSMASANTQTPVQDNNNNGWGSFVSSTAPTANSLTSQVSNGQIFGGTSFQQQQQQQQQPKKQVYE